MEEKLIEIVNILIEKYNPCKIKDGGCLVGNPVPCCLNPYFAPEKPCPYIGNCKKTASCALWFCRTALKNMDEKCKKSLYALEEIAKINGLLSPSAPCLGEPYEGVDN